ncbi:ARPP-1 family domain-containing protein [Candidatus Uabimicrobium sp. HlEnr_7]|uniref:ARPP-1 family domain-containing protein n=1 Tax=Candidatus Uabimicrobium helgolandensis TaxID=3095367 RepID=UPI0035581747
MKLPNIDADFDNIQSYPKVTIIPILCEKKESSSKVNFFLWQGVMDGSVEVQERASGYLVKSITAKNYSGKRFLGYRGNILRGGGQNRHLQHSFVLSPKQTTDLPVQCIQEGRWNPDREQKFYSKGAETTLSTMRFHNKSQQKIWETIYKTTYNTGTISPSQDFTVLQDALSESQPGVIDNENQENSDTINDIKQQLQGIAPPVENQIGIIVLLPPSSSSDQYFRYQLEIYHSSELYHLVHKNLVSSFLIDANSIKTQGLLPSFTQQDLEKILTSISKSEWEIQEPIGEEKRWRLPLSSTAFGEAIFDNEHLLHFMYASNNLNVPQRRIIDKYHLIEKLGQGEMGTVFLAYTNEDPNKRVAIKILNGRHSKQSNLYKRFLREARVQMQMVHPNVVQLFGVGQCEKTKCTFIVMEYTEGKNLETYITQKGPLNQKNTMVLARELAKALELAREKNIIHRDIKPGNIIFRDMYYPVKLLDFGLGKCTSESDNKLTVMGTVMGTPYYFSPQQLQGEEGSHLDDIYSLGATMYHMLAGHPPYAEHKELIDIATAILEKKLIPIEEINPDINKHTATVIAKAMAYEKENRFQTAAEMVETINTVFNVWSGPSLDKGEKIDEKFADYKLVSKWGENHQEQTYLAQHLNTDKYLILKRIKNSNLSAEKIVQFLQKMKQATTLEGDLLEIIDYGHTDGHLFSVLKCYNLGSLYETQKQNSGAVSVKWTLRFIKLLSKILLRLEQRHFFIEYINPKTTWFNRQVMSLFFRYTGLDEFREMDDEYLYYLSPEQIRGKFENTKSNVYSLGVLMYTLLSKVNPFQQHESQVEIMSSIINGDFAPVHEAAGDIHNEVANIITHAMTTDHKERPSLDEFLKMIDEIMPNYEVDEK